MEEVFIQEMRLTKDEKDQIKFRLELVDNTRAGARDEFQETAERMIALYKGEHFLSRPAANEDRLIINYAQVNTDILTTSLAYNDPALSIRPLSEKARGSAELQKAALTKTWVETDSLAPCQHAMQDASITGKGIVFVGWRYETMEDGPTEGNRPEDAYDYATENQPLDEPDMPVPGLPGMPEAGMQPMAGIASPEQGLDGAFAGVMPETPPGANPMPGADQGMFGEVSLPESGFALPETDESPEAPDQLISERVVYDNPIVRRVDPLAFWVDPDHHDLENLRDAKYVVEIKEITLAELKKDSRFKGKKILKDIKGTSRVDRRIMTPSNMESDDVKRVVLYDYWQKDKRIHVIICEEQLDEPLLVEPWPYRFPTYPYVLMAFRRIPNQQDPQGQIEPAETCIKELDKYRSIALNHDKRYAKGRTAFDKSKLTPGGMKALKEGEDGALIEVQGNPNEVFGSVPDDPLPADFYNTGMNIKQDISVLMGVDDWSRGTPDRTRRTKGEVDTMMSKSATRGQFIQVKFERFCSKIATLMLMLLQDESFCDNPRWIELKGDDGNTPPQQFYWNYSDVIGQSDVEVIVNSTRVQTPESLQQKWVNLLQMMGPFVQAGAVDITPVMEEVLKSFEVPESIRMKISQNGGGAMQQMQQALQQGQQMMQQMGQAIQQMMSQGQQIMQQVEQLTEKVQEMDGRLDVTSADAKTQMQIKKMEVDMQLDVEKHKMEMLKMQQELQVAAQMGAQNMQMKQAGHDQKLAITDVSTGQKLQHQEDAHKSTLKSKEILTKAQARAKSRSENGSKKQRKKE